MDLTPALETLGDAPTLVLCGLLVGMAFGVFAQRSRFCLRAAAIEFVRGSLGAKMAVWLLAFSTALAATQALLVAGVLDVSESRQLGSAGSLSGAILGGLMFGTGMVLARGCASRLLVLSANGNLRALLSGLVFTVTAQASLRGAFAPLRDSLAGLWTVSQPETLELTAALGIGHAGGLALGLFLLATAVTIARRNRIGGWAWGGAVGVGGMVALGWLVTYDLSMQSFAMVQVESMSFTGPSADMLMVLLSPVGDLDFDVGLIPGVFLGSFAAAALGGDLKLEGFQGGHAMRRYIIGAVLMGFGGMLAGGCAVGAGVTGGAIMALPAWVALFSMWIGAGVTDFLVDRKAQQASASLAPAP